MPVLQMGCDSCSHPVSEPGRNVEFIRSTLHTRTRILPTAFLINGSGLQSVKGQGVHSIALSLNILP